MKGGIKLVRGTVLAFLLCGCASEPKWVKPMPMTYCSREMLEDADKVSLPNNYSVENFKKRQLFVILKVEENGSAAQLGAGFSRRLEVEMDKWKRYSVFSQWGRAKKDIERIANVDDEVNLVDADGVKASDLVLHATVKLTVTANDFIGGRNFVCVADGDFKFEDVRTRQNLITEKARGVWGWKEMRRTNGELKNMGSLDEAKEMACLRCISIFKNKVNNDYPVGGRIINIIGEGETMAMENGRDEGIANNQQVTVFLSEDGIDIPIAYAEATPSDHGTSQLLVYRWSDAKDAKPIVKEIRESQRKFLSRFKKGEKNGLYAVAYGVPEPTKTHETEDY